jgi:hypothetical protein
MPQRTEDKNRWRSHGWLVAVLCMAPAVHAQSPDQLLRGVLDTAKQARQRDQAPQQAMQPARQGVTAADMLGPQAAAAGALPQDVLYPNRKLFLEAARTGKLQGFNRATAEESKKVVLSVQRILMTKYKVPPISQNCYDNGFFASNVSGLLGDLTAVQVLTLSDQPPEFTNNSFNRDSLTNSINARLANLQTPRDRTQCDEEVMGKVVHHPYKLALVSLAGDYAKATAVYVEQERSRRKTEYQEATAQKQDQERQRKAAASAAEQQRIDAEAARVRQDEQKRAQKEKARIGG